MREEKNCEWDHNTISTAAYFGNIEILSYCLENQCPGVDDCCESAAHGGQLECLKHLHEVVQAPWDNDGQTALNAVDLSLIHI